MVSILKEITQQELQNLLDSSCSYADILRKCKLTPAGGNYTTLRKLIKEYNLDETKLNENRSLLYSNVCKDNIKKREINLQEVFEGSKSMQSYRLMKRLVAEGYKEYKCEICGIDSWNGMPLTLHLHHKNGNHEDNSLDNLQVLCPNCHSQTDNYTGKNIKMKPIKSAKPPKEGTKIKKRSLIPIGSCELCGKDIYVFDEIICSKCKSLAKEKSKRRNNEKYNIETVVKMLEEEKKTYKEIADYFNLDIGVITNDYKKYKGIDALQDIYGDREFFKEKIRNYSFLQLAKMFGVSDNAIRKWCIKMNLPYKSKEIHKYTDDEWLLI